jgi:hypothetical protein
MKWSTEAVELLNSLERYAILKAIEEGKQLVAKVMVELKSKNKDIEKVDMQAAIQKVLEEIDNNKVNRKTF